MDEMICWIESVIDGQVTNKKKLSYGQSRETWLVDASLKKGDVLKLVLRVDRKNGPLSGTELSLSIHNSRLFRGNRRTSC